MQVALMKNKFSSLICVGYFSRKKEKNNKVWLKTPESDERTAQSIYVKEWQSAENSEGVMYGEWQRDWGWFKAAYWSFK